MIGAWWWLSIIAPNLHHHLERPRLRIQTSRLDRLLKRAKTCLDTTRFTPHELNQLCNDMFVSTVADGTHNWRLSPRHRVVVALWMLANHTPLRKGQHIFGWAIASLTHNLHAFVDCVIDKLDAPGSSEYT